MGKVSRHKTFEPFGPGASGSHPAQTGTNDERNEEYIGQFTHVLSNRALNEVKGGYSHFGFRNELLTEWSKHWQAAARDQRSPRITSRASALPATPTIRAIETNECRSCAMISRSPSTRAVATT
jgi:hypothetical protein